MTQLTGIFCTLFAFIGNIVIKGDGFSLDKAAFKICVDDSGGLWSGGSNFNGPGANFSFPGGQEGHQSEQGVSGGDEPFETGLVQAVALKVIARFLYREFGKFRFDLLRCAVAILPAALLWGASFPLALAGLPFAEAPVASLDERLKAAGVKLGAPVCEVDQLVAVIAERLSTSPAMYWSGARTHGLTISLSR